MVLGVFGIAYAWGALTVAKRVFPFTILQKITSATGVTPTSSESVQRRSGRTVKDLTSLGYIQSSVDVSTAESGVILHDESRAYAGLNLYNEWASPYVRLVDMKGEILHEWVYDHPSNNLHHAELLPNGDLVLTEKDYEILKLDQDSNVLWRREMRAHHDLWVNADGSIWAIDRETRVVPELDQDQRITFDLLVHLSGDGTIIERVSLLDSLLNSPYRFSLAGPASGSRVEPGPGHSPHQPRGTVRRDA